MLCTLDFTGSEVWALFNFSEYSLESGHKKSLSWAQTFECIPGFHIEVTKIQTKKLLVLLSFYFHVWGITPPKHFCFCKLPGKLLCGIKMLPIFWDSVTQTFLSQNIYRQMFLLVSGGQIYAPHQSGTVIQSYINFGETIFPNILHTTYRKDSWRGFLYIYLPSIPTFWTFCIKWSALLFLIAWQWKQRITNMNLIT